MPVGTKSEPLLADLEPLLSTSRELDKAMSLDGVEALLLATAPGRPLQPGDLVISGALLADDRALWILIGGGESDGAELDALARSFLWPSYARPHRKLPSSAPTAVLDVLAAVDERSPIQLLTSSRQDAPRALSALSLLLAARGRRPLGIHEGSRHIATVLRDLDDALARGDSAGADRFLAEARRGGRLSLANEAGLRLRVAVAAGEWDGALTVARSARLLDRRLPRDVAADLIIAVYQAFLSDAVEDKDLDGAIQLMRDDVIPEFGSAFADPGVANDRRLRTAWLLRYASAPKVFPRSVVDVIFDRIVEEEERALADAIVAGFEPAEGDDAQVAMQLVNQGERAPALEVTIQAPEVPIEQKLDLVRMLSAEVSSLDPSLLTKLRDIIDAARETEVDGVDGMDLFITGWIPWLERLVEDDAWSQAHVVLKERSSGWSVTPDDGFDPLRAGELLGLLAASENAPARDALPLLVHQVTQRCETVDDHRKMVPLYVGAAEGLDALGARGIADVEMVVELVEHALVGGVSASEYELLCRSAVDAWKSIGQPPRYARIVVDLVTTLSREPARVTDRRDAAIGELVSGIAIEVAKPGSSTPSDVLVELREVLAAGDLLRLLPSSIANVVEDDDAIADEFAHLAGRRVLVHSLVPNVPGRVRARLEKLVPGVSVVIDDSHVGGPQLREHVRNADLVLLATRACKHAVSGFIMENRGAGTDVRQAAGKGWCSLLDAARLQPKMR